MFQLPHPLRGSIMRRLVVQATALTALTIVTFALLSLFIVRSLVRQSALSEAGTLSSVAEESVEKSLQFARERTSFVSENQDLLVMVLKPKERSGERAWSLASGHTDTSLPVIGLSLTNAQGEEIVRVGQSLAASGAAVRTTSVLPSVTSSGLTVYDAAAPLRIGVETVGTLRVRYDATSVMAKIASLASALGASGEAMVSFPRGGDAMVFRPSTDVRRFSLLPLPKDTDTPTSRGLQGSEGVAAMLDDEGVPVFASYRYMPDIGWGLAVTVKQGEALATVDFLTALIAFIGLLLLILAGIVAIALSRTITHPLRSLAEKVQALRPGAWAVRRTVETHDEVEVLDRVVVDMATRLKKIYENMESVIRERTQELAEQYARDSAILENIEYAVVAVDANGMVTDANPAASVLLGADMQAAKGKAVTDVVLFRAHHGNALEGEHPAMICLREGQPVHSAVSAHWNILRLDQTVVPVSCSISPLRENGRVFGAIIVLQDVSEERRLDYLKSEFITLASHQLRTPLSALRWYVELIGDENANLSEDQKGYVKEMGVSLKRMANLLDSLLRASQMEEGGLGMTLAPTDINQLIEETDEDFRSIAQEKGVSFSVSLPDTRIMADTDPTLLRIVLQNLLSNATKYTRKDSHVTLTLDEKDNKFSVSVADEGYGIPLSEQKRVFQKFFRAANVRKMDTDGNGLGLYITKSIVERLGGTIRFASEENKGTTFTATFPLAQGAKKTA